jgi:hypothetical protein
VRVTAARDIVPAPANLSSVFRCESLPKETGVLRRTSKSTASRLELGVIPSTTRFPPRRLSQRVFKRGTVARHDLHGTVRAHKYATVGFATQRGVRGSFSFALGMFAFNTSVETTPCAFGSNSRNGCGSTAASGSNACHWIMPGNFPPGLAQHPSAPCPDMPGTHFPTADHPATGHRPERRHAQLPACALPHSQASHPSSRAI